MAGNPGHFRDERSAITRCSRLPTMPRCAERSFAHCGPMTSVPLTGRCRCGAENAKESTGARGASLGPTGALLSGYLSHRSALSRARPAVPIWLPCPTRRGLTIRAEDGVSTSALLDAEKGVVEPPQRILAPGIHAMSIATLSQELAHSSTKLPLDYVVGYRDELD